MRLNQRSHQAESFGLVLVTFMTGVQLLCAQQCRTGVNVNLLLVYAESDGSGYVDDVQAPIKINLSVKHIF